MHIRQSESLNSRRYSCRRYLHIAVALALNGCAQSPTPLPPAAPSSGAPVSVQPASHFYGNDWMYASQPSNDSVVVYKRNKKTDALKYDETMSSGLSKPMGMETTPDGHLYVANSGDSNVPVYRTTRKGPRGPIATLGDSGEVPVNVAATSDRRLVAVSNASNSSGGAGSVSVYLNRRTQVSRVLTYGSDPIQGQGVAIDSSGNCFWSFNDPKTLSGSIVEFTGCNGTGSLFASGILAVGGIAFDRSGNLYYVDQLAGIYKCSGPSSCGIFLSIGSLLGELLFPKNLNFDNASPQNLWIADAAGYIDAVNLNGLIVYYVQTIGGILNPPDGIAPAPGS